MERDAMAKAKVRTEFDAFDGRSVSLKSTVELTDGLTRIPALLAQCGDADAHAKMWRNILSEIKTELHYRENRDPRMPSDRI